MTATIAPRLRAAIASRGTTVYALARELDPSNPERAERNLRRWLAGSNVPGPASRLALAEALELPDDYFEPQANLADLADLSLPDVLRLLAHAIEQRDGAREREVAAA